MDILLRNADIALYRAKDSGRNQVCRYSPRWRRHSWSGSASSRRCARRSARPRCGWPISRSSSSRRKRRRVRSADALDRQGARRDLAIDFHPDRRGNRPDRAAGPVGLGMGVRRGRRWDKPYTVAVNLSPAQFDDDDLVASGSAPRSTKPASTPARLELEVTEGMLLQDTGDGDRARCRRCATSACARAGRFRHRACRVQLFAAVPIPEVQDRPLVRAQSRHLAAAVTIVEEMLLLARRLEMKVVAEGVELEVQCEHLRRMGCDFVQGYLTGRPVMADVARSL